MHSCPGCGTPTAPSWEFCPRCSTHLVNRSAEAVAPANDESDRLSEPGPNLPQARPKLTRTRTVTFSIVLVVVALVVAGVALQSGVRNQLHTTQEELASSRNELSTSQHQLKTVQSQLSDDESLIHEASIQLGSFENLLANVAGATTVRIPAVQGTGGTLFFYDQHVRSLVSVSAVLFGANQGATYALASGPCPETLNPNSFTVSAVQPLDGGTLVLGPIGVSLPNNGTHFWLRLYRVAGPQGSNFAVLAGVIGPFNPGLGEHGSSVAPNRPAC